jgi:hypothetical protein
MQGQLPRNSEEKWPVIAGYLAQLRPGQAAALSVFLYNVDASKMGVCRCNSSWPKIPSHDQPRRGAGNTLAGTFRAAEPPFAFPRRAWQRVSAHTGEMVSPGSLRNPARRREKVIAFAPELVGAGIALPVLVASGHRQDCPGTIGDIAQGHNRAGHKGDIAH